MYFYNTGVRLEKNDKKVHYHIDYWCNFFSVYGYCILAVEMCFNISHFWTEREKKQTFRRNISNAYCSIFELSAAPAAELAASLGAPTSTPVTAAALAVPRVQGCWAGRISVSSASVH